MDPNWASEHLQVIRTIMERTAVYRRALAPVMIFIGAVGALGALCGILLKIELPGRFILFWAGVSPVAVGGSLLLIRRQALKEAEPFWSPPTRRISQALLPPLAVGMIIGLAVYLRCAKVGSGVQSLDAVWSLPLVWAALYGCAFHAAGFFMPRGMKLFGWAFVLLACLIFFSGVSTRFSGAFAGHLLMGVFFGFLHLAYGVYLYFTEPRRNNT